MSAALVVAAPDDETVISLVGTVSVETYRPLAAAIDGCVDLPADATLRVDAGDLEKAFAPAILPLIVRLLALRQRRPDLRISFTPPRDDACKRMFMNAHWAALIDPDQPLPNWLPPPGFVPATRFADARAQQDVVNRLMDAVLGAVPGLPRPAFSALEWALNEITDNVLTHAQSPVGGLVQLTRIARTPRFEIVVADAGAGIAHTLRTGRPDLGLNTDATALAASVQEEVTSGAGQGNGLFGSFELARRSGGNFMLHANHASFFLKAGARLAVNRLETIGFQGSMVECGIRYDQPDLLERALVFGGRNYRPSDLIDYIYEPEDGELSFLVRDEVPSTGARLAATPFRTKIINLLRLAGAKRIILDFNGLSVISSSFADELVGKLFLEIGPVAFNGRIRLDGMTPIIAKLIDRAIAQRMRQPRDLDC